jgi:hypothetical protein
MVAEGSDVVVIESGTTTAAIVIDSAFETDCCGDPPSATTTVKLNVPAVGGVPEIVPVEALIASPPGSAPVTLQAYGVCPPLAATVCEYATPTVPDERLVVVIVSVTGTDIVAVPDFPEPDSVAVIVASPLATAVTSPPDTVATLFALDCHVTVRPVSTLPEASLRTTSS